MASRSLGAFVLSSTVLLSASLVLAAKTPTTCYVIDGTHNTEAGFRCDNSTSGHSACCQIGGVCYSNGVCQQMNGGFQDFLRVGCTDPTWQDPACLDQCTIYARNSIAGIRFCGASIESTNQYCCDNGTSGIGSFACCKTPNEIFDINPIAKSLAQIPLSYKSTSVSFTTTSASLSSGPTTSSSSSSTSTVATSSTTSSSSSSSSPAASATASASSDDTNNATQNHTSSNHALAIGLGVGIPLLIITIATIIFFVLRRRCQDTTSNTGTNLHQTSEPGQYYPMTIDPTVREMPGWHDPSKMVYAGRPYDSRPQELHDQARVHEMPSEM